MKIRWLLSLLVVGFSLGTMAPVTAYEINCDENPSACDSSDD